MRYFNDATNSSTKMAIYAFTKVGMSASTVVTITAPSLGHRLLVGGEGLQTSLNRFFNVGERVLDGVAFADATRYGQAFGSITAVFRVGCSKLR